MAGMARAIIIKVICLTAGLSWHPSAILHSALLFICA